MSTAHAVIAFKGTHLASHGALSESKAWAEFWAVFFIEVRCRARSSVAVQILTAEVPSSKEPKAIVLNLIWGRKKMFVGCATASSQLA